ncbi:hypothetical protein M0805_003333 [Coniferiporia weirii]|nr:hypothetical protein M0805_003333 [Coniferiporia weirii]
MTTRSTSEVIGTEHKELQIQEGTENVLTSSPIQTERDLDPFLSKDSLRPGSVSQHALEHRWKASGNAHIVPAGGSSYGSQDGSDLGVGEFVDSKHGKPLISDLTRTDTTLPDWKPTWEGGSISPENSPGIYPNVPPSGRPEADSMKSGGPDKENSDDDSALPTPGDYHRFYWKCMGLKSELVRLDFALRPVGSSGPGIQAANVVKIKLRQLRDLSGMNTSALFPHDANVRMYTPTDSKAYLSQVSRSLEDFAEGLDMMAKALNDFNGVYHDEKLMLLLFSLHKRFMDEAMKTSICYAVRHARATEEFRLHFQMLLKDWIEAAVESLTEAVRDFNDKGVRTIYSAQQHKTSRYLDMTTIATFFSAVTASMLQFTINNNLQPVSVATNTFMFSSLVFSIGSAVNSLLVTAWRRSFVREPDQALSPWFSTWLNAGPMVSLVVAGAFFSVALCLLMFSSSQHLVTTIVVVAFSGIHAAGLLLLSVFFISEKWKFRHEAGPVGSGLTGDSLSLSIIDMAVRCLKVLKLLQRQQRDTLHETIGVRGGAMEAQIMLPQKAESFEPFESQALQNALSDETFLLNSTYIYGLSQGSWTAPTLAPADYTFRTADKGGSPLYADAGWGADANTGWGADANAGWGADANTGWVVDANTGWGADGWSAQAHPTPWGAWGQGAVNAPWGESQPISAPIIKMEADQDAPILESGIISLPPPHELQSYGGNASQEGLSLEKGSTSEKRMSEQEQRGHDDEISHAPEHVDSGNRDEGDANDPGHQLEQPEQPEVPRPPARPVWRTVQPQFPRRRSRDAAPAPYMPMSGLSAPVRRQAYGVRARREATEDIYRAAPRPQPGSDVHAAALFMDPNQSRVPRTSYTPFIPPAPYDQPGTRRQAGWAPYYAPTPYYVPGQAPYYAPGQMTPYIAPGMATPWYPPGGGQAQTPFIPPLPGTPWNQRFQSGPQPHIPYIPSARPAPSWATWQPDAIYTARTPPPPRDPPGTRSPPTGLFGPRSPRRSVDRRRATGSEQDLRESVLPESLHEAQPPAIVPLASHSPQRSADGHEPLSPGEHQRTHQPLDSVPETRPSADNLSEPPIDPKTSPNV